MWQCDGGQALYRWHRWRAIYRWRGVWQWASCRCFGQIWRGFGWPTAAVHPMSHADRRMNGPYKLPHPYSGLKFKLRIPELSPPRLSLPSPHSSLTQTHTLRSFLQATQLCLATSIMAAVDLSREHIIEYCAMKFGKRSAWYKPATTRKGPRSPNRSMNHPSHSKRHIPGPPIPVAPV